MRLISVLLVGLLLMGPALAYTLPATYVVDTLNVKNATALNATSATSLDVNGATTCRNVTLDANYNIVTSGTGTITSAATITGEHLTSTDDGTIADDLSVGGNISIDSLDLGNRATATDYNYATAGVDIDPVVMVDARAANRTITLPLAANAPEKMVIVKAQYAPGSYFVRVNVTTSEHINGKDLVYTTDDASTFMPSITLYSNGGTWYVINAYGTWASADV